MKKPRSKELNERQKAFCDEYFKNGGNASAAAKKTYSAKDHGQVGYQLMKNPKIQQYILDLESESASSLGITLTIQLKNLQRLFDVAEKKGDIKGAAIVSDQINKLKGFYKDTNINLNIQEYEVSFGEEKIRPIGLMGNTTASEPDVEDALLEEDIKPILDTNSWSDYANEVESKDSEDSKELKESDNEQDFTVE